MLAFVPAGLAGVLSLVDRVIDGIRGSSLPLAVMELRGSLTRATALAATGALAVFGTVAIQGAHRDLLHGLDVTASSLLGTTDIWVTAAGDENILMTTPFKQPDHRALLGTGVVSSVRAYRGEFLDMAGRRVWVMARPPNDRTLIPPTRVQEGEINRATSQIRAGGWAALSASIADDLHVGVGDPFTIPTPAGQQQLHVAAVVSNLGWAPGSMVLNGHDYRRWWPGSDVTALEVDLRPGISPAAGKAAIQRALPAGSPLLVETQTARKARFGWLERQGLNRLTQISTLLLLAAVLAMGAAMAGAVWLQRRRLATRRMQGYSVGRVLRLLLTQATLVLAAGALIGTAFGLYGQALGTRWLQLTTGFLGARPVVVFTSPDERRMLGLMKTADEVMTGRIGLPGDPEVQWYHPGRDHVLFTTEEQVHHGSLLAWRLPEHPKRLREALCDDRFPITTVGILPPDIIPWEAH